MKITALEHGITFNEPFLVKLLLKKCVSQDSLNSALVKACCSSLDGLNRDSLLNRAKTVSCLLKTGASPSSKNEKGKTTLTMAARLGNVETVRAILEYDSTDMSLQEQDMLDALLASVHYEYHTTWWGHGKGIKEIIKHLKRKDPDITQNQIIKKFEDKGIQKYLKTKFGELNSIRPITSSELDSLIVVNPGCCIYVKRA